jgi:hypothetical protein
MGGKSPGIMRRGVSRYPSSCPPIPGNANPIYGLHQILEEGLPHAQSMNIQREEESQETQSVI